MLYTYSEQSGLAKSTISYFRESFDNRYITLSKLLHKFDTDDVAFVECNSLILNCLGDINATKLASKYRKVIIYMSELYWDSTNTASDIDGLLDDNVFIIFNFFSKNSPYELKTKSYTSIGSFLDITNHYLRRYNFEVDIPKYNLISKFGRPSKDRLGYYDVLKKYDSFICSINNFEYGDTSIEGRVFESEKNLSGDYKSTTLPKEDFQSIFSLDIETRLSQYEEASYLVSCTEKTLKSFMFKRPSVNVIQKEAYDYLESFGFEFPNYFGLDHKTQQLEICKHICSESLSNCKDMALEYKKEYQKNYQTLLEFLEYHKNKLENIFYELYHK